MASIARDKKGNTRIQFVAPDGKRPAIRLGKVSKRTAKDIRKIVERLLELITLNQSMDPEVAKWLSDLDQHMMRKLAKVGLLKGCAELPREYPTLAAFIDQYIASKPGMKPNTVRNYETTKRSLVEFFGAEKLLRDVTPGDADEWRARQVGDGYASATISRNVKRARQFFRAAQRKKLIVENPMADLKSPAQVNKAREFFVTREAVDKIIAACPDAEWRLIVALARYGGLRTPSESYALRIGDIDWDAGRIRVRSPKTAHYAGGESRLVPLFPELRPYLDEVYFAAPPGTEYLISKHRKGSGNLRTQFERIIERAGEKPWPRLFQNLRASRETELTREHPLHVVVAWIGNSAPVAAQHYLQVTDDDFERAKKSGAQSGAEVAQKAAQPGIAECGTESQQASKPQEDQAFLPLAAICGDTVQMYTVPPRGVEPLLPD